MKFQGKVVGVQPLSQGESTLFMAGHMEERFVKIEITASADLVDRMFEQYGYRDKGVPVNFGNGEDL